MKDEKRNADIETMHGALERLAIENTKLKGDIDDLFLYIIQRKRDIDNLSIQSEYYMFESIYSELEVVTLERKDGKKRV
jgi:hypothetical protein